MTIKVVRAELAKIASKINQVENKTIAGVRLINNGGKQWTLMGGDWTLHLLVGGPLNHGAEREYETVTNLKLYGDRDRFVDDYVMLKLMLL